MKVIGADHQPTHDKQPISVRHQRDPYALYERWKRELPPNLTPAEYTAACLALARRAGIE